LALQHKAVAGDDAVNRSIARLLFVLSPFGRLLRLTVLRAPTKLSGSERRQLMSRRRVSMLNPAAVKSVADKYNQQQQQQHDDDDDDDDDDELWIWFMMELNCLLFNAPSLLAHRCQRQMLFQLLW
jgi:uncharacterized membrane protein YdbT with pleckstrin-like domain